MKLKGLHFETVEVIEAESQAELNTLIERDFEDEFKDGRSTGKRLKFVFDQIMSLVPEIID
jgi:hypothetical protein